MQELYDHTLERRKYIEERGYTVVEMWECDYDKDLKTNMTMKAFIDTIKIASPLDPRQAFFGGRTNAVKLYHEVEEGEKIKYYDVCSLYPWVNKVCTCQHI